MKNMTKSGVILSELDEERIKNSKVIATMNSKGGCSKTTSSIAFGVHMARLGKNVLFLDTDPQSNMSQRLGLTDVTLPNKRISTLFRLSDMEDTKDQRMELPMAVEYPNFYRARGSSTKPGVIALLGGSHNAEIEANSARERLANMSLQTHVDIYDFFKDSVLRYKKYFDYIMLDTAPAMEGNILNKVTVRSIDEIICPIDGLEAALGLSTFIRWIYGETNKNDIKPNVSLAMVKYHVDTKAIGDASDVRFRNSVYRTIKDSFGDFVCDNGVKDQRAIKHAVQGFKKTDFMNLSNELNERFEDKNRENFFDVVDSMTLDTFSKKLNIIEKKTLPKKPVFKNITFN